MTLNRWMAAVILLATIGTTPALAQPVQFKANVKMTDGSEKARMTKLTAVFACATSCTLTIVPTTRSSEKSTMLFAVWETACTNHRRRNGRLPRTARNEPSCVGRSTRRGRGPFVGMLPAGSETVSTGALKEMPRHDR